MNKLKWLFILVMLILFQEHAQCQFFITSLPKEEKQNAHSQRIMRVQEMEELKPISLPFWDDFSFSNTHYPHDELWEYGKSIWVTNGMGINAPSLGVAVFDGIDSLGKPYSLNNPFSVGVADRLVSAPINLEKVPVAQRSSVVLSFYYQYKGNGEAPDANDELQLFFKNNKGLWIMIHSIKTTKSLDPTVFTQLFVPLLGEAYFHDTFQFKIQNYGRLSGPYDTWIIDYIYVNARRTNADASYPDRTINAPLSSLFNGYWAIPLHHFIENPTANLSAPILSLHNLESIPGSTRREDYHPINYTTEDEIIIYKKNAPSERHTHRLDNNHFFGILEPLSFTSQPLNMLPDLSIVSPLDSAVVIKLKTWINTNDNLVNPNENPPGDYDPVKYAPIDFRHNDTTYATYQLSNYYAYDDGTAEYGAGLNQPGAKLAYLFEMKTAIVDTLEKIQFYFPLFGEKKTPTIEFQIWQDLNDDLKSVLYQETIVVKQSSQNQFQTHTLNRPVIVHHKFYLGWTQKSTSSLAIGLDKNTDTGAKIFFNINGSWEQNTTLVGSLMMRPVFGKGVKEVITSIASDVTSFYTTPFPNPSKGLFTVLGKSIEHIKLMDLRGHQVAVDTEKIAQGTQIKIHDTALSKGLYLLHMLRENRPVIYRIIIE